MISTSLTAAFLTCIVRNISHKTDFAIKTSLISIFSDPLLNCRKKAGKLELYHYNIPHLFMLCVGTIIAD